MSIIGTVAMTANAITAAPTDLKLGWLGAFETDYRSVSSQTITYPSGIAAGDLIILAAFHRETVTTPAGYTLVATSPASSGQQTRVWFKIADGTETGNFTLQAGGTDRTQAQLHVFRPNFPCSLTNPETFLESNIAGRSPRFTNPLNENAIVMVWGSVFGSTSDESAGFTGCFNLSRNGTDSTSNDTRLFGGLSELAPLEEVTFLWRDNPAGENGVTANTCVLCTITKD